MMRIEKGRVLRIIGGRPGVLELMVQIGEREERAIQYTDLSAPAVPGQTVLLNTTAVRLGLGTGGYHFVLPGRMDRNPSSIKERPDNGHIMKLRYTPGQIRVFSCEEPDHPAHSLLQGRDSLGGMPVIAAEPHSMLPAIAATISFLFLQKDEEGSGCLQAGDGVREGAGGGRAAGAETGPTEGSEDGSMQGAGTGPGAPGCTGVRVAYVMTDGGALPLAFSKTVAEMRDKSLICGIVTVGHAFGGDLEAVNLYSGLLAARHVLQADLAIVAMGPGIVGTGTLFGHTGIEQGQAVNAAASLNGIPVACPRLSFSDSRPGHRGICHHTLTALGKVALAEAFVPLPILEPAQMEVIVKQLRDSGIAAKHRLVFRDGTAVNRAAAYYDLNLSTMGRTLADEQPFFMAAGAAARIAVELLERRAFAGGCSAGRNVAREGRDNSGSAFPDTFAT